MDCYLNNHESHEKTEIFKKQIEEYVKVYMKENDRLKRYRIEVDKFLLQTTETLNSLSKVYQQKKKDVTSRAVEWHRKINKTVKTLHKELDDMQKEHESLLHKQKKELEEIIGKVEEMNTITKKVKNSYDVLELQKYISVIEKQETVSEISQYMCPMFCSCEVEDSYIQSHFGYIENIQERNISLLSLISEDVEMSRVITAIDAGFPADEEYNDRLYDIVAMGDKRVWMGGASTELKLFDFQGVPHDTVPISKKGVYLTIHNKQVVYTESRTNSINRVADDKTIQRIFTTGEWTPFGITSTASDDLLVCLLRHGQSKVVRYNSTGTILQEIQYDSQGRPLYGVAVYITENINADVIITDVMKCAVIAVDIYGIFRFSYLGQDDQFHATAVTTDPSGHVIVTDSLGDKIHMLDSDGRFLRYIIPDQGIKVPRAVCIVGDGEMIVGEEQTGIAKRIKY
jgi:hypothetical protein